MPLLVKPTMFICCVPPPPIGTGALGAAGRAPPASSAPPQHDGPLAGAGQQGGGALTRTRKTLSISVLCPVPPAARVGTSAEGGCCWRASSRAPDTNAETAATAPTTAPLPVAGMPTHAACPFTPVSSKVFSKKQRQREGAAILRQLAFKPIGSPRAAPSQDAVRPDLAGECGRWTGARQQPCGVRLLLQPRWHPGAVERERESVREQRAVLWLCPRHAR